MAPPPPERGAKRWEGKPKKPREHETSQVESPRTSIDDYDRDEVVAAIRTVILRAGQGGVDRDKAIQMTASALGFKRTGAKICQEIDNALRAASVRGVVYSDGGRVHADCRTINDYTRDLLKTTLLSAIDQGWWHRDEAIRFAAYHLGFRRTGSRICQAFKSAINGLIRQDRLEADGEWIRKS